MLVVIAVIALLVALLLPALGKARKAAWQAISLGNMGQSGRAWAMYVSDHKSNQPFTISYPLQADGTYIEPSDPNLIRGACSWTFQGKNCNGDNWYGDPYGFDFPAYWRPLNAYLADDLGERPTTRFGLPRDSESRRNFKLDVCRDPSDKQSHQWYNWPLPRPQAISCYDDVGTSYHLNFAWFLDLWRRQSMPFGRAWVLGKQRFKLADAFQPSRMVAAGDEYMDIVTNNEDPRAFIKNGYGDYNRGILLFLDGHALYQRLIPGYYTPDPNNPNNPPPALSNDMYTMVFPDLHLPPN